MSAKCENKNLESAGCFTWNLAKTTKGKPVQMAH